MNQSPLSLAVSRATQINVRQAPLPVSSWNRRHTSHQKVWRSCKPQVVQQCMLDLGASLFPDYFFDDLFTKTEDLNNHWSSWLLVCRRRKQQQWCGPISSSKAAAQAGAAARGHSSWQETAGGAQAWGQARWRTGREEDDYQGETSSTRYH